MSLPIAATPTLKGNDLVNFYKMLDENEGKRIPKDELLRSIELYNAVVIRNPWMKRDPIDASSLPD